jgi:hypothetical protein
MFLAKSSLAKNLPPIRKKIRGEKFSGEEFSDEESSSEEFSGNPLMEDVGGVTDGFFLSSYRLLQV